jgi:hypothetical protein
MASFDVYVLDGDGEPVASELVKVRLSQPLHFGEGFKEEFTDDSGHAEFEVDDDNIPDKVEIFVRGDSQDEYDFSDGAGFTVNI